MSKSEDLVQFPDPSQATLEGIVAVGGKLEQAWLLQAYRQGIFPWPHEGYPLLWFSPDPRGVLDFSELHVPSSLIRWARKQKQLSWTVNKDFAAVIRGCKTQPRADQKGTWLSTAMEEAYIRLHQSGHATSLEVWDGDELIGGIYGVQSDKYFSAESMFYKRSNASKFALWKLVEYLKSQGHQWMDIQMVTPVTQAFGGKYIDRKDFLERI